MKTLRAPKLILCSLALGMVFFSVSEPAYSFWPVIDATAIIQAVKQVVNQGTQIANEGTQIANQVKDWKHGGNITLGDGRASAVTTFANAALSAQSVPSTQAITLAQDVIKGQNGALSSADLRTLMNDIQNATTGNSSRDAEQEGQTTVASTVQELAVLEASKITQDHADYLGALKRQASMMDTLGQPTDNFSY